MWQLSAWARPGRRKSLGRAFAFAMFPGCCRFCDQPTGRARDLCVYCDADLPRPGPSCARCGCATVTALSECPNCVVQAAAIDRTIAALRYAPPVDRLIADLKFHGRLHTAPLLGDLLAETVLAHYAADALPQAIVPVPLSWRRLLWRGHNQSMLLARETRRGIAELRTPPRLAAELLRRTRHTAAQSGNDIGARQRNLRGAFASQACAYRHVAVLDDVFTTGATLNAAASALRGAGAERVDAWVVARTQLVGDR